MIQDWGYNYIYLCHPNAMTQSDMRDHSYKDVVHTPIMDMVSNARIEDSVPSWLVNGCLLWLSKAINKEKEGNDATLEDHILEPFLEHEFEPHGWRDILETLDVCSNVHAAKHYEEEGYDLISMNMVNFVLMVEAYEVILEANKTPKSK